MARPLRIELAGGMYHVTARGNERRAIFRDDRDRKHFLEILEALPSRFGTILHAYVLMDNHYHLILETPEANLSRASQWINLSYGAWFNRRHDRIGHLFQGRFKSHLIEPEESLMEVARYVHLNPVRVGEYGLSKQDQKKQKTGAALRVEKTMVQRRLRKLWDYRWSSYPAYQGKVQPTAGLTRDQLYERCGRGDRARQQEVMRQYVEEPIREGMVESPWDRLVAGVILGSKEFVKKVKGGVKGNRREQEAIRRMEGRVSWEEIVQAVEGVRQGKWKEFRDQHGDWGRDAALYLGRHQGRMKLRELAEVAGGIHYAVVGAAVSRFGRRLKQGQLESEMKQIQSQLSKSEM